MRGAVALVLALGLSAGGILWARSRSTPVERIADLTSGRTPTPPNSPALVTSPGPVPVPVAVERPTPPVEAPMTAPNGAARRRALVPLLRRRLDVEGRIAAAVEHAEERRFDEARDALRAALALEPDDEVVNRLLAEVEDGRARGGLDLPRNETWWPRPWLESVRRCATLDQLVLVWPSVAFFDAVHAVRGERTSPEPLAAEDLSTTSVAGQFEAMTVDEVARRLSAETAIDVVASGVDAARTTPAHYLEARSMPLSAALDALLAGTGLAWRLEGARVEIVAAGVPRASALKLRYFDVSGLASRASPVVDPAPQPDVASADRFEQSLRAAVHPEFWSLEGAALELKGTILVVKATPDVLRAVEDWLNARRAEAGTLPQAR
jgi:hypothetical protein